MREDYWKDAEVTMIYGHGPTVMIVDDDWKPNAIARKMIKSGAWVFQTKDGTIKGEIRHAA